MKEEKITITNAQELRQEKCNVPTLRFCEFTLPWERIELKSIIKEIKQYTSDFDKYPLYSFTIENGVTPKTDRYERNFLVTKEGDTFKVVPPNTFVMNPMNLRFGAINYSKLDFPVSVSGYYNIFEIENGKNNDFWAAYFLTKSAINLYNSVATGSLIEKKRVHFSQFIGLKFLVPTSKEKEKITYFIRLIDKRLAVQNKIISKYETLIKGISNILIHSFSLHSKVKLSDILLEYNERTQINNEYPILSSTMNGIFAQSDYFNKQAASEDTIGYKKVPYGYCTYRSMSDTGVFKFNLQKVVDLGIVSPAYPVFTSTVYDIDFVVFYMNNAISFKRQILEAKEGGTRFALSYSKLIDLTIPNIPKIQQKKIVDTYSTFSKKIEIEKAILSKLKEQKDYLLSKMFI